ncbi:MAG: transposase [Ruminococcus sp.]|uniref:transposase n=1 Tax=Ruminococcoides intestinihominis TaxID=3133161 RepID=UPI001B3C8579
MTVKDTAAKQSRSYRRKTPKIAPKLYSRNSKLEGFNNKTKVAKRIGYGYRDDDFFFTLIRYLSIPSVRSPSHKKS